MTIQGVIDAITGKKKKKKLEGSEKKEKHHHHHSKSSDVAGAEAKDNKEKHHHHKHPAASDKTAEEKKEKHHHKHRSKKLPTVVEPTAVAIPAESPAKSAIVIDTVAEQPMPVVPVAEPVTEKEASSLSSSQRSIVELLFEKDPTVAAHAHEIINKRKSLEVIFSSEGSDALGLHGRLVPPHSMTVTKEGIHYQTTAEAVAKMDREESTLSQREIMAVGKRARKEVALPVVEEVQERKTIGKKVPK